MTDDEILEIAIDVQADAQTGHQFATAQAADLLRFARLILAARAETYAAANPLGGPATMFEAIARRLRAGEDYQAVLDDYGVRVDGLAARRMIVCPDCGNKRCPRAAGLMYSCTNSNAPIAREALSPDAK